MPSNMQTEWPLEITGTYSYDPEKVLIRRAVIRERMSTLFETHVEFIVREIEVEMKEFLGKIMTIRYTDADGADRYFSGTIVRVERLALKDGMIHLLAELRPWLWMLTRTTDCRIFQNKTAVQIIEQIFSDHGFSDFTKRLSGTYAEREYCVQYRETDFAFVSRLMEEEGIYYYFDHSGSKDAYEKLVLSDGPGSHDPITGTSTIKFEPDEAKQQRLDDSITEWGSNENVTPGVVTLYDSDFMAPSDPFEGRSNRLSEPIDSHTEYERYDYPGHFRRDTGLGTKRAEVRMLALDAKYATKRARGTVRTMATGSTFTLEDHPHDPQNDDYLVTAATYYLQTTEGYGFGDKSSELDTGPLKFPENAEDMYTVIFDAQPKSVDFKAPLDTPWPRIPGLHTALVTGPAGEEIYTDEYGRIKVQFYWDREGQKDENTTCWIRVVTPWSGKNWGMIHIPRIGQEVVIQFEEGDPDRPICTGMLYNADTMPPWPLTDNMTQSGIMTRSTKQGSAETFNELMFEDKIDEELVRFQAQKDYLSLIKDRSATTVGLDTHEPTVESTDEKSYALTVKNHMTEIVKEGDHTFTVETGNQIVTIETDQTETIRGRSTRTVTGDHAETIEQGNKSTDVSMGDITVNAALGSITVEAMVEIKLIVGQSSITIDQTGVTIEGMMIGITGQATADMKSPMTTVKGDAMLTLKGGVTMIN